MNEATTMAASVCVEVTTALKPQVGKHRNIQATIIYSHVTRKDVHVLFTTMFRVKVIDPREKNSTHHTLN